LVLGFILSKLRLFRTAILAPIGLIQPINLERLYILAMSARLEEWSDLPRLGTRTMMDCLRFLDHDLNILIGRGEGPLGAGT